MKCCPKCKILRPFDLFAKDNSRPDKLQVHCKICQQEYRKTHKKEISLRDKNWREKNKEYKAEQDRLYRLNNIIKIKLNKQIYSQKNKERRNKRDTDRRHKDIQFRLMNILRNRVKDVLKRKYKSGSAVKDLGCTGAELIKYLQSKFQPGMNWDNYGQWHIDHIKPLSKFDLTDRAQFLIACHYTNLQPLWAEDNIKKGNKYELGN